MAIDRSKLLDGPVNRFQVGDCLSLGFSVWARNLLGFALISAVIHSPLLLYQLLSKADPVDLDSVRTSTPKFDYVTFLLSFLLPQIATGAMTYGVVQHLRGQPAGLGACISVGLARLFPVLGVGLLVVLCILGGFLLLVFPAYIIMCMLWVAVPVAVIERPGVMASLRRSSDLTRGARWPIFAVIIVLGVIGFVVGFAVIAMIKGTALIVVQFVVSNVLLGSLMSTMGAVGYWLLRSNREGAKIEDLAKVFD